MYNISKKFNTIIFSTVFDYNTLPQTVVGPHRIATEIRNLGLSCQVIHHIHSFSDEEIISVLDNLVDERTILVGFSTVFWSHFTSDAVHSIAIKVRVIVDYFSTKYPKCKIVGGGGSSQLLLKFGLSKLDALFEGYPEAIFVNYISSLQLNSELPAPNEVVVSGNLNVSVYKESSEQTLFDFRNSKISYVPEDYLRPNDVLTIEVARGCIFKCKFCAFPLNGKNNYDYIKNVESLREELEENYEKYQIQNYVLSDDTFNDSMYKLESLYKMFKQLPFKIRFSCYLRLDLLNAHREQIDMLKEMGLTGTFFGIESFYKKSASLIGKGLNPDIAKELINDLKIKYWKNDVKVAVGLITGLPFETYESYENTKKWILSDDNLVEQIRIAPLYIPNPVIAKEDPNISLFQKDAVKYGFYWPHKNHRWKNLTGPVKSYDEATEIANELKKAAQMSMRELQGGFNIFQAWRSAPIIDPTVKNLEELVNMNRFEFSNWIRKTYNNYNHNKFYDYYKKNFLK